MMPLQVRETFPRLAPEVEPHKQTRPTAPASVRGSFEQNLDGECRFLRIAEPIVATRDVIEAGRVRRRLRVEDADGVSDP